MSYVLQIRRRVLREIAQDAARDFLRGDPVARHDIAQRIAQFNSRVFLQLIDTYLKEAARSEALGLSWRN